MKDHPVTSAEEYEAMQRQLEKDRLEKPLIADNSVDVIVSNCVLNLVADEQKRQLFDEMFRVLKVGGRIAISDIISDEISPDHLKKDDKLWSGCISGALQEAEFLVALEDAGFHGIVVDKYESEPWQIVEGIEYRSVTVLAWKGEVGQAIEKNQAVIYKGPFKQVEDEDGNVFERGERMAVSEATFKRMTSEPYSDQIVPVEPALAVLGEEEFDNSYARLRSPQETKTGKEKITSDPAQSSCC